MNTQQLQPVEDIALTEEPKLKLTVGPKLIHRRREFVDDSDDSVWVNFDATSAAQEYLFDTVALDNDLTLADFFRLLEIAPVLQAVMRRNFCEEFMVEARKGLSPDFKPGYGPEAVEYLELRRAWNFNSSTREYEPMERLGLLGIGYELREPLETDYGLTVETGQRQEWDVSLAPLRTMLSLPVRTKNEVAIWEEDYNSKNRYRVIETVLVPSFTLGQVLHGVMWGLSYFGGPQGQDEMYETLAEAKAEFERADASSSTGTTICPPSLL